MIEQLWDDPQVFCIQIPLPDNPLKNLNVYVLRSGADALVIDTGFNCSECRDMLLAGIREVGLDLSRTSLFLTHLHSDHIGLVQEFVRKGCAVYMHKIDYDICCQQYPRQWRGLEEIFCSEGFPQELIRQKAIVAQKHAYDPELPFPAVLVSHGTRFSLGSHELLFIHTPGHTPGHTVLYLPEQRILFTGDHVLFHISPNISIWEGVPNPLSDYLDSLELLRALPVKRAFPAHRNWEGNFHIRIGQLIRHHEFRLKELLTLIRRHPGADAFTLAGYLSWSARELDWETFPPHQKWFAMGETLAHLYYLLAQGQIQRDGTAGDYHYSIVS